MSDFDFDAVVVGAGAVGLACGYALARRGLAVVVLESDDHIGAGVSSRNSEVIHAGLHYPTGSLKARLCVAGRRALYAFLERHGVAFDRCGKIVVATNADEAVELQALAEQARTNGVEGLTPLTADQAHALEPELKVVEALGSSESGLFDSHGYMLALQGDIEAAGGADPASLSVRFLVTAPGLQAQEAARSIEGFPHATIPRGWLGKGCYFALTGKAPFQRLIYPTPVHGSVGLHYRRDMGGQARFGPDLSYVDSLDYTVDPALAPMFYASIRRYWPGLPDGALVADYAGIRPKLHGPNEPQTDFRIDGPEAHGMEGLVALFGIESPGLTSSLAIGEEVAGRLGI